jgi:uncharacterized membrane protein required for colicin V production
MGRNRKGAHKKTNTMNRGAAFLGFLTTFLIIIVGFASLSVAQTSATGNGATTAVTQVLCNIYNQVSTIIFVLAITLMVVGGAIYAGSHLLPAQTRGQFQGYAMGMIVGGVIGVIIVIAAPFIIGQLEKVNQSANSNSGSTDLNTPTGNPCAGVTGSGGF